MALQSTRDVDGAVSILKGGPHPNAALLWTSGVISEGQKVYAQAGETPLKKSSTGGRMQLTIDDHEEFPKYEKLWKELFQIR